MKHTRWYQKIAAIMAAGVMLAAALPVQASSNANVISTTGETSLVIPQGEHTTDYFVENIPFTVSYKPVSGNHAPAQNFVFVLEPETAGAPLPKLSDDDKNKNTGDWYAEESGGKILFTVKMPAISDGTTKTVTVKMGEIGFNGENSYSYRLYQQIPKSGDANYSAYIDQNAQGGKYDTTSYTMKLQGQLSNGKRELGVSVFKGSNTADKTIPEFANEYKPPIETPPTPPSTPPPSEPPTPVQEPPTVLGALRELPQVLGAMRDAIMTGDTSALTIATIVFAGTCVGLAIILANNRKKHENEDNAE